MGSHSVRHSSTDPGYQVFTIVGGTTLPDRAAVVRDHCREGSRVELRRPPQSGSAAERIDVWLQCKPRLGLIPVWKQIGHVPVEAASRLVRAEDATADIVAYGTVRAVYAPVGREEAVVSVALRPQP